MPRADENKKELFLRACRFEPVHRVPVWIMRQAGRYLPEYQAVRARHFFLEICKTPELAAEVSIQPFRALDVDAIIVFSDILIVAEAMGLPLDVPDSGPVLSNPVGDVAAIRRLRDFDPERDTRFVADAIRAICKEVGPSVPVIGFAAAPWTLACYMIEGQTRGDISRAKQMLRGEPTLVRELLDRIAGATTSYLKSQIAAGASAIQLFDTWAGELTPAEYDAFELPATQMIFSALGAVDVPKILFAKGSARHLGSLAKTGANVLSVDCNTDLAEARRKLGPHIALQGNVDPGVLLGDEASIRRAARAAIEKTGGLGHILNLGHGILPTTPVANAKAFVDAGQTAPIRALIPAGTAPKTAGASRNGTLDVGQISEELLAKYNRPGPRYTSYPTAPVWKDDFGPDDLEQRYAAADLRATPLSLYMHLPFCESLCLFCACNVSIQKDKGVAIPYLASLKQEIDHVARMVSRKRPVIQFHWGGGTPTYLSPAQLEDLFAYTRERFFFAPDSEIGIEIDPRVTSRAHLETLRRLGFNRLSMGIQDFEPKVQETIHRVQPYEMTRDLIAASRELGFESLNVDLIYGLPYQTAASFEHTIDQVLTLAPDRVAMFSYAHVPWLKKQQGAFAAHLPEGPEKFRIFRAGLERFLDAGYVYIGMDHFARPEDELATAQRERTLHRNFQGYTTKAGTDLYGMGVSAISSIGESYAQNRREIPAYQTTVAERGIATMRGYRLSQDDVIRRAVIGRLLCHTVISKQEIEREFAISFDEYFAPELASLEESAGDGLVALDSAEIHVTPLGRIFIRNIAMAFDRYLHEQQMDQKPLFSKTL
jgi:oxygen-independent coproporphyrinogen III oxidase